MTNPQIWIVGAGAIGSVLAGRLGSNRACCVVDAWHEHVQAIREGGLRVDYPDETVNVALPAFPLDELDQIGESPDIVILAVKSYATRETLDRVLPFLHQSSIVVSFQNGINEEAIASAAGANRTIGAVVIYGGELLGPGHARGYALQNGVVVGELNGAITNRVELLAETLRPSLPTRITDDIWSELWSKLVVNAKMNAICAFTGLDGGRMVADPRLRRIALEIAREAVAVALRLGLKLDSNLIGGEPRAFLEPFASPAMHAIETAFVERWGGASVKPSMLQDVEKGRPTEIDALNGYVAAKARDLKLPAPVNSAITGFIKVAETEGYEVARQRFSSALTDLVSM
jgi:2-dehydropantoate 2-reductase